LNFNESQRDNKKIEEDGWYLARQKGSHKQYKHKIKKGLVTIAAHKPSDEIAPGTLNSILKPAQIKEA
jgi:predicted RNA binding protein YcfA (HicA-like mRNA interferase family)